MNRLNIVPQEDIGVFTIGESPMNLLLYAAEREYHKGIKPLVAEGFENSRTNQMEAYAAHLAIYDSYHHNVGKLSRTNDGCRSDLKFNSIESEMYIGIQIKTCSRLSITHKKCWNFAEFGKDYRGLLMYCRSLEDGIGWLFPYDDVRPYYKSNRLDIPYKGNGKYIDWNKYKVRDDEVAVKIREYHQKVLLNQVSLSLQKYEDIMLPVSKFNQLEQAYRARIVPVLKDAGLNVRFPFIGDLSYDMILGNLKVQEKIAELRKRTGLQVTVTRRIGRRKKGAYNPDDFDLLLVHLPAPYDKFIYLIPVCFLIKYGILRSDDKESTCSIELSPDDGKNGETKLKRHNWSLPFLINLEDPNLYKRIKHIYNMQVNKSIVPVVLEDPIFWDFKCQTIHDVLTKWNIPRIFAEEHHHEILGKRVLNRGGYVHKNGSIVVTMHYEEGSRENRQAKRYNVNSLDFILIVMSGEYKQYCFIIPVEEMIYNLGLYDDLPDCIYIPPPGKKEGKNIWIHQFLFDYTKDEEFKNKLIPLMDKY